MEVAGPCLIVAALAGLGAFLLLGRAWHHRHYLQVLPDVPTYDVAEALTRTPCGPVAVRGRAVPHSSLPLTAPASGRDCVWWRLQTNVHSAARQFDLPADPTDIFKRETYRSTPGGAVEIAPLPFRIVDGTALDGTAGSIEVKHDYRTRYEHVRQYQVTESFPRRLGSLLAGGGKATPVTDRIREVLPEIVPRADDTRVRSIRYREDWIEEGEPIVVVGQLEVAPVTGDQVLLTAYAPPDRPAIFSVSASGQDPDVAELHRGERSQSRLGRALAVVAILAVTLAFVAFLYT